jgi:NADP-dependent 3-hydroxy acid dehydrogenase YdfG
MNYARIDVRDETHVNKLMGEIAATSKRLDGMICAAGINIPRTRWTR